LRLNEARLTENDPLQGPGRAADNRRGADLEPPRHLDPHPTISPAPRVIVGILADVGSGIVAALMGVAGGEQLIPTIEFV
jgi:hypothetical protein